MEDNNMLQTLITKEFNGYKITISKNHAIIWVAYTTKLMQAFEIATLLKLHVDNKQKIWETINNRRSTIKLAA